MKQPLLNLVKPRPPKFVEKFYSNLFWRIPQPEKTVYITFDDGPEPAVSPWIIDTLAAYNIRASFFCVGSNITKYPQLYSHIAQSHCVGSHTYNHENGWKTRTDNYIKSVNRASQLTGNKLFRPPHGKITPRQARLLTNDKYNIVMWDVLTKDYDGSISGEECYENVKNYTRNGSIIVFHDSKKAFKNLQTALPKSIEWLLKENYTIKSLDFL